MEISVASSRFQDTEVLILIFKILPGDGNGSPTLDSEPES